jgi:hypothetical protein
MKKHNVHKYLRDLGYQNVISYVHRESSCIVILCYSNIELNLAKIVLGFQPPF